MTGKTEALSVLSLTDTTFIKVFFVCLHSKPGLLHTLHQMEITITEIRTDMLDSHPQKLPYLSLFVCTDGNANVSVNLKEYELTPSDFMVLYEDSLTIFTKASDDFRLVCFLIDKELASEIGHKLPGRLFSFLALNPVFNLNADDRAALTSWLDIAQIASRSNPPLRYQLVCNHFQNFFLYMSGRLSNRMADDSATDRFSRKENLCWELWELICRHYKTRREVTYYASRLCVTPAYLSQITRSFLNETPKSLIERQVVAEIKKLLLTTDMTVSEIADHLNFTDPSYMCRFFKRTTGMALTEYKTERKRLTAGNLTQKPIQRLETS